MDITVEELHERIQKGDAPVMIDVREPYEWEVQHLDNVKKIQLNQLPMKLDELTDVKDKEVVMICRSGNRSGRATEFLKQQGFANVRNLKGGMKAWKEHIDSSFDVA